MVLNIAQNLNILYVCPNIANINCWKLLLFRTYKCRIWFLFVLGIIKESEDRMSICYSLTLILWMRCTIAMHLCLRSVLLSSSRQVTGLGLINSQLLSFLYSPWEFEHPIFSKNYGKCIGSYTLLGWSLNIKSKYCHFRKGFLFSQN